MFQLNDEKQNYDQKDEYPNRVKYDKNILSLTHIISELDQILANKDVTSKDKNWTYENGKQNENNGEIDEKTDNIYLLNLETTINNCIISDISEISHILELLYLLKVDINLNINYENIVKFVIKDRLYNKIMLI